MGNRQNLPFNENDVRRVLGSPEGKKLLQMLNRDGGQTLRKAADALRTGNPEEAMRILSPVMESDKAAGLIEKLNRP